MDFVALFDNIAVTVFTIFKSLLKKGVYVVVPVSSGWEGTEVPVEYEIDEVVVNGLSQDDKKNISFFVNIQPTDTIIMVKGTDIRNTVKKVKNSDKFRLFLHDEWQEFEIVDHDTDPAEALFTLLLRK